LIFSKDALWSANYLKAAKKSAENLKHRKDAAIPPATDTIAESIQPYAIAEKLRGLRLRKSMGLAQLAEHTGLSVAMLSKLENARQVPTLQTLVRISLVFNVGLDYFFTDPRKRYIVAISRKTERRTFPADPKEIHVAWHFESLDFRANERRLNGYLAHFHPLAETKTKPHFHPGVELLYLLEGDLELSIGTEVHRLSAGDAAYFDSIQKHSYRSVGPGRCTAVVVTAGSAT
jgi:transcriptional regulator with XRE-family HTH domain